MSFAQELKDFSDGMKTGMDLMSRSADIKKKRAEAEKDRPMTEADYAGADGAYDGSGPQIPTHGGGGTRSSGKVDNDTKQIAGRLKSDLMKDFGISSTAANGIVASLAAESGGFRTLQEISPTVKGSRGGWGYAQWTGPRRDQFNAFAQQNGYDPSSYEANYGFLKHELMGPEGRILKDLANARNDEEATSIFTGSAADGRGFLRPGTPNMAGRYDWARRLASNVGIPEPEEQPIVEDEEAVMVANNGGAIPEQPVKHFAIGGISATGQQPGTKPVNPNYDRFRQMLMQRQQAGQQGARQPGAVNGMGSRLINSMGNRQVMPAQQGAPQPMPAQARQQVPYTNTGLPSADRANAAANMTTQQLNGMSGRGYTQPMGQIASPQSQVRRVTFPTYGATPGAGGAQTPSQKARADYLASKPTTPAATPAPAAAPAAAPAVSQKELFNRYTDYRRSFQPEASSSHGWRRGNPSGQQSFKQWKETRGYEEGGAIPEYAEGGKISFEELLKQESAGGKGGQDARDRAAKRYNAQKGGPVSSAYDPKGELFRKRKSGSGGGGKGGGGKSRRSGGGSTDPTKTSSTASNQEDRATRFRRYDVPTQEDRDTRFRRGDLPAEEDRATRFRRGDMLSEEDRATRDRSVQRYPYPADPGRQPGPALSPARPRNTGGSPPDTLPYAQKQVPTNGTPARPRNVGQGPYPSVAPAQPAPVTARPRNVGQGPYPEDEGPAPGDAPPTVEEGAWFNGQWIPRSAYENSVGPQSSFGFAKGGAIPDETGPFTSDRAESAAYQTGDNDNDAGSEPDDDYDDVEASPTLLDGVARALHGGLNFIKRMFGVGGGGGIPTPEGDAQRQDGARRFASGEGAATQEEIADIDSSIDPDRKLDEGNRQMARLSRAVDFYKSRGRDDEAEMAAASLMQYGAKRFSQLGSMAQVAYQKYQETGDRQHLDTAMQYLEHAYKMIPDGAQVNLSLNEDTGELQAMRTDSDGQTEYYDVSPDQLPNLLRQVQDKSMYWGRIGRMADPEGWRARQRANEVADTRRYNEEQQDETRKYNEGRTDEQRKYAEGQRDESRKYAEGQEAEQRKYTEGQEAEQRKYTEGQEAEQRKYTEAQEEKRLKRTQEEADRKAALTEPDWEKINPLMAEVERLDEARIQDPNQQAAFNQAASRLYDALPTKMDRNKFMRDQGYEPQDWQYDQPSYTGDQPPSEYPDAKKAKDGKWYVKKPNGKWAVVGA